MNRDNRVPIIFFTCILIIIFFAIQRSIVAQEPTETPLVDTYFGTTCIEALGETHYRIHFGYTSDGIETYNFYMGSIESNDPSDSGYSGTAFTNVPSIFTTEVGTHTDWYLDAHSEDSPYTFHLIFYNDVSSADMPLNTWDVAEWCNNGVYSTPEPGSTPEPTSAFLAQHTPQFVPTVVPPENRVYWAFVKSGTGQYYWSRVSLTGTVLDLPPSSN